MARAAAAHRVVVIVPPIIDRRSSHARADADGQATLPLAPGPLNCADTPEIADRSLSSAIVELAKPRITRLVTLTALGGLALSAVGRHADWRSLLITGVACALGTALCSGGANAINQVFEFDRDARMNRTRLRPIPSGRVSRPVAALAAMLMLAAGLTVLMLFCGAAATVVSALTALTYVAIYTPLKPLTVLNTWVGTIPGALPPLIGWTAAGYAKGGDPTGWASLAEAGGWSLFALMAVWQIPHFLALAWLYRDDYARGGYRMLPVVDESGRATVTQIVIWSILLIPATLLPWLAMPGRVGPTYAVVALVTGLIYLWQATRLVRDRSPARARSVFLTSVIHLPVLILALAVSAVCGV
jgi:protoheme IX farnesyltransferase